MERSTGQAWVRGVPASVAQATTQSGAETQIEVGLARQQHARYVEALGWLGYAVRFISTDDALPDSVYVEDTAVLASGRALVTRSNHPVRCREAGAVAEALRRAGLAVTVMEEGALDGGDVLRVGAVMWVGLSQRTDHGGVLALKRCFEPIGVQVRTVARPPDVLHLKCVVSRLTEDRIALAQGSLDPTDFAGLDIVEIPQDEAWASNVVSRGGRVLVGSGHPGALRAIASSGATVREVDTSEFRKGDGSLTCLSLRHDA